MSPCFLVIQNCLSDRMVCRSIAAPAQLFHRSNTNNSLLSFGFKDVEYLAAYFPAVGFAVGGTSIIYGVTDMVFSLKQHIPPSGELLFCRSILSSPPESWPIEICCTYFDSTQNVSLIHLHGVMALLSDSFPFTVR